MVTLFTPGWGVELLCHTAFDTNPGTPNLRVSSGKTDPGGMKKDSGEERWKQKGEEGTSQEAQMLCFSQSLEVLPVPAGSPSPSRLSQSHNVLPASPGSPSPTMQLLPCSHPWWGFPSSLLASRKPIQVLSAQPWPPGRVRSPALCRRGNCRVILGSGGVRSTAGAARAHGQPGEGSPSLQDHQQLPSMRH